MHLSKKTDLLVDYDGADNFPSASSSRLSEASEPPPTFAESVVDRTLSADLGYPDVYVPPGGEAPPPEFTPYEAEYFESSNGDIISHDPHLNQDGEALYRFLLSQSENRPRLLLFVHGDHTEERTRTVTRTDSHGKTTTHFETDTDTVTDFDFQIDVSDQIQTGPVHWSVLDEEAAYRGAMYKEVAGFPVARDPWRAYDVEVNGVDGKGRRKATRREAKSAEAWRKWRRSYGLPPWIGSTEGWQEGESVEIDYHRMNVLRSSKTLREWADEYCASDKRLKEFTYKKVVYGWKLDKLEAAVVNTIKNTYYNGRVDVSFKLVHSKICIRPDNGLSRTLSHRWVKIILWILLIYPFIWLYKRFSTRGGGRWEVCGGAYALKYWKPVDPSEALSSASPGTASKGRVLQTDVGMARLHGMREGEWFQKWEGTIKRAVTGRLRTSQALTVPDERLTGPAVMLDGYCG